MSDTLPQLSLGAQVYEGEVLATVTITAPGPAVTTLSVEADADLVLWQDRRLTEDNNLWRELARLLNAAEAAAGTGGAWALVVGARAGHVGLYREPPSLSSQAVALSLPHHLLTPDYLGLAHRVSAMSPTTPTPTTGSAGTTYLWDTAHVGGLWLPPDPPSEGPGLVSVGVVSAAPSRLTSGPALVLDLGACERGLLAWELLPGAWLWRHHAQDEAFQAASAAYASAYAYALGASDHNAALESLQIWHRSRGPLRYYADRDDLDEYVTLEVDDAGWLSDLRGSAERVETRPALYRVQVPVKLYEEE